MNKRVAVISALVTQAVLDLNDVRLLEQPDWSILELSHLKNRLGNTRTAHADRSGAHSRLSHSATAHTTRLSHAHLFAISKLLLANRNLQLILSDSNTVPTETVIDGMVLDNRTIQGKQVKSTCRVSVLKVGWETEGQDHVHGHFRANKLKNGWALWNREQEDVSFFVGSHGIVRAVESVSDLTHAKQGSQTVCILILGFFWIPIAQQFLPADNWTFQLDILFPLFFSWHRLLVIDEQEND